MREVNGGLSGDGRNQICRKMKFVDSSRFNMDVDASETTDIDPLDNTTHLESSSVALVSEDILLYDLTQAELKPLRLAQVLRPRLFLRSGAWPFPWDLRRTSARLRKSFRYLGRSGLLRGFRWVLARDLGWSRHRTEVSRSSINLRALAL